MIQVGDKLVAAHSSSDTYARLAPRIVKGRFYVANRVRVGHCGTVSVDVGFDWIEVPGMQACSKCGAPVAISDVPFYAEWLFRKIEPEYKAVMVDSEISEQAKELIGITETIANQ